MTLKERVRRWLGAVAIESELKWMRDAILTHLMEHDNERTRNSSSANSAITPLPPGTASVSSLTSAKQGRNAVQASPSAKAGVASKPTSRAYTRKSTAKSKKGSRSSTLKSAGR